MASHSEASKASGVADAAPGRVLLTGRSGFTGRHVAERLEALGHEVVPAAGVRSTILDLTRRQTLVEAIDVWQPDFVIHLAAISFVAHDDATALYAVNTVGTEHLLHALAQARHPVRKVVLASSANVYGNATVEPIDERTPPAPVNHYACSKLAMEHIARTWFGRLPIVITRPFNYTGPGQDTRFLVPKIVSHFARGEPRIELGNLDVVRDFSDVRMVADVYCRLLTAPVTSDVVNICSGEGRSLRSIIEQISDLSGRRIEVQVNPAFVRASEVHRLVGDPAKLQSLVGAPSHTDFARTLADLYRHEQLRVQ